jgi:hypothetical protein
MSKLSAESVQKWHVFRNEAVMDARIDNLFDYDAHSHAATDGLLYRIENLATFRDYLERGRCPICNDKILANVTKGWQQGHQIFRRMSWATYGPSSNEDADLACRGCGQEYYRNADYGRRHYQFRNGDRVSLPDVERLREEYRFVPRSRRQRLALRLLKIISSLAALGFIYFGYFRIT